MRRKPIILTTVEGRHTFYTSPEWKALRSLVLIKQPFCAECLKNGVYNLSTEVDHIIPIADNPTIENATDIDNLNGLCKSCHSKKTIAESDTKFGKKKETFTVVNKKWR